MVNYAQGKIYIIRNDVDDTIYVGRTAQKYLASRMTTHRSKAKERTSPLYIAMQLYGISHFRIVLDHLFPCSSKEELNAEEDRTHDAFVEAKTPTYNQMIGSKHSEQSKAKMSESKVGDKNSRYGKGRIHLETRKTGSQFWKFNYQLESARSTSRSFSCRKYGFWEAKNLCYREYKLVFPSSSADQEDDANAFAVVLGAIEY